MSQLKSPKSSKSSKTPKTLEALEAISGWNPTQLWGTPTANQSRDGPRTLHEEQRPQRPRHPWHPHAPPPCAVQHCSRPSETLRTHSGVELWAGAVALEEEWRRGKIYLFFFGFSFVLWYGDWAAGCEDQNANWIPVGGS